MAVLAQRDPMLVETVPEGSAFHLSEALALAHPLFPAPFIGHIPGPYPIPTEFMPDNTRSTMNMRRAAPPAGRPRSSEVRAAGWAPVNGSGPPGLTRVANPFDPSSSHVGTRPLNGASTPYSNLAATRPSGGTLGMARISSNPFLSKFLSFNSAVRQRE